MKNWWEADEYAGGRPMAFPDHRAEAKRKRVALTTDPVLERHEKGGLRLRLANRHPHEAILLYRGRCVT